MKVMVVDGDWVWADALVYHLGEMPETQCVGVARSPAEALELARAERPGIALVELVLGRASGLTLARTLRTRHPAMRIALITSEPSTPPSPDSRAHVGRESSSLFGGPHVPRAATSASRPCSPAGSGRDRPARRSVPWRRALTLVASACLGAGAFAAPAAAVPAGWAQGGTPQKPHSQHQADATYASTAGECGPNAVVLYRVRGSGEPYTNDRLGQWTFGAGTALIRRGWRVRDLQARYSAPEVPISGAVAKAAGGRISEAKRQVGSYRATADREVAGLRRELVEAYNRCTQRAIVIAGYSLGNIVVRQLVLALPAAVRSRIVAVDLVSDPSADPAVDRALATSTVSPEARRGLTGIETWLGTSQRAYPVALRARTIQYCADRDIVCDTSAAKLRHAVPFSNVWKRHAAYPFNALGALTGQRVGSPPPAPSVAPTTDPTPDPGTDAPAPPTAANLAASDQGGGRVAISFDVGWQAGRDPITCSLFDNGALIVSVQCGTRFSRQLQGVAAGRHTYHATATDRFGVTSAPTNSVTLNVAAVPTRRPITVDNRVTDGMGMREDAAAARLTTKPWIHCTARGCNIAGTEAHSGAVYDAAVCQTQGERTTNGHDTSPADDANPLRFESTRYYGVRLTNGVFGYISEVWIRASDRGGLGLPAC